MLKKSHIVFSFLALGVVQNLAFAVAGGAYSNQALTARGISRMSSVVATIDDASAVAYNPARLSNLKGGDISVGITAVDLNSDYTNSSGNSESLDNGIVVSPNFFVGSSLENHKFSVGLGVTTPWALKTDWSENGPLRYIATESELITWDINPGVSYRFNESFSLGAGLNYYNISTLELKSRVNVAAVNTALGFPAASPDGDQTLEGDGTDLGFNLGLAGNMAEKHFFGITYKSGANVKVEGDLTINGLSGAASSVFGGSSYKTDINSKVLIPRSIATGYGYKPNENWVIEADLDWFEWSKFKEQTINYSETSATRLAVLNANNPVPRDWRNVWAFGLGTEFQLNEKWALRGGYGFISGPVPNSTFEAAIPDSDYHAVTLGVGYDTGRIYFDFSPQFYFLNDRHIDNNVGATSGSTGDGGYESMATYYSFNVGYKWGQDN